MMLRGVNFDPQIVFGKWMVAAYGMQGGIRFELYSADVHWQGSAIVSGEKAERPQRGGLCDLITLFRLQITARM